MRRLTKEQVVQMQARIVERYGGHSGIRDEGLFDAALNAPFQTFGEEELFPTLIDKAARLGYGLVKNHPFLDGNKRIGALAFLVFLEINSIKLKTNSRELTELIIQTAAGEKDEDAFREWVSSRIAP